MTRRARTTRRGRTGRDVWVNTSLLNIPQSVDGLHIQNLLLGAPDFMTFDMTINRVIIPTFVFHAATLAATGTRQFRWALQVAPKTMDSADFEPLFTDSVGPPWLATGGAAQLLPAVAGVFTFTLAGHNGIIDVKAKRRFRENDSTLFLITENRVVFSDTDIQIHAFCRTLLHIP